MLSSEKENIWGVFCPILIKFIYVIYSIFFSFLNIKYELVYSVYLYIHIICGDSLLDL